MTAERLVIGVWGDHESAAGWRRVLEQDRLPYAVSGEAVSGLTLFADTVPSWLEAYVSRGGVAVISGAPDISGLLPRPREVALHRFVSPVDDVTAVSTPMLARLFAGDGFGRCRLHEDRKVKGGNDPDVYPAVLERRVGDGVVIFTGLPLTRLLGAEGDCLRTFAAESPVTERVSSVDKAEIADVLVWMLRRGFRHWGAPYIRLGRFPAGARSAFVFRVDVDGVFGDRAKTIAQIASAHDVVGSFFFNGSLCEEYPGDLGSWVARHEVGHHGYFHNVFDGADANLANLRRGQAWVEDELGVVSVGFVAPRGLWNAALDQALSQEMYRYSSEFAVDFDSLPFRTEREILQIPVHPYSPERASVYATELGLAQPSPKEVRSYYLKILDRQLERGRPVHVYGHPQVLGDMAVVVLPALFDAVKKRQVPTMTLSEMAQWWSRRESAHLDVEFDKDNGRVSAKLDGEGDPGVTIEILDHPSLTVDIRGRHVTVPAAARSVLSPREGDRKKATP